MTTSWLRAVDDTGSVDDDARVSPLAAMRAWVKKVESGEWSVDRVVLVLEHDDGHLEVCASGWHGDDVAPAVALLEAGKLSLILDALTPRADE